MATKKGNAIRKLNESGQSVWLDYISRSLLETGKLNSMIDEGLRGMTSNPTIFDKSISNSADYDDIISSCNKAATTIFDIYDALTVRDIQDASDAFLPVYRDTRGLDGYVSLEINPKLAHDAAETVKEGMRLHRKVDRPNLMVKVPSTQEGFIAIEELIASGINVNATLIFSQMQYEKVAGSYVRGLKRLYDKGGDLGAVRSVASVFVSRLDTVVDRMLDERIAGESNQMKRSLLAYLKGKAAVANCACIYKSFRDIFASAEFAPLKGKGACVQRVLWASTSAKNPAYEDIKYVTELIAPETVNTMPENTYTAFLDHGVVKKNAIEQPDGAYKIIETLHETGIEVDSICGRLLRDGLQAFVQSFDSLLISLEKKTKVLV